MRGELLVAMQRQRQRQQSASASAIISHSFCMCFRLHVHVTSKVDKYIEVGKRQKSPRIPYYNRNKKKKKTKRKVSTEAAEAYGGTEFTEGEMNRFLRP